jgi:ATP/ADP translocase
VYISLDEEGRTKGKAAIDVVGSQAGKSGGSVLQQVCISIVGLGRIVYGFSVYAPYIYALYINRK